MNEKSSSELGSFLAGFVIGGLVGAATAIILAPQSGSDTRAQISGKSYELRDVGSERIHHSRESASHKVHEYQARTHDAVSSVQDQARIVLDRGKNTADEVDEQIDQRLNDVEQKASDLANGDAPAS